MKQGKIVNIIISAIIVVELVVLLFIIVNFSADGSKGLSVKEFKKIMEENSFSVFSYKKNNTYIAANENYQVEFYSYDNNFLAREKYKEYEKNLVNKKYYKNGCKLCEQSTKKTYSALVIKGNTVMYIGVFNENKENVKELLKSIGYYCK